MISKFFVKIINERKSKKKIQKNDIKGCQFLCESSLDFVISGFCNPNLNAHHCFAVIHEDIIKIGRFYRRCRDGWHIKRAGEFLLGLSIFYVALLLGKRWKKFINIFMPGWHYYFTGSRGPGFSMHSLH